MSDNVSPKGKVPKEKLPGYPFRYSLTNQLLRERLIKYTEFRKFLEYKLSPDLKEVTLSLSKVSKLPKPKEGTYQGSLLKYKSKDIKVSLDMKTKVTSNLKVKATEVYTKFNLKSLEIIAKLSDIKDISSEYDDPQISSLKNFIRYDLFSTPFSFPLSSIPKGAWFKLYPAKVYIYWDSLNTPKTTLKERLKLGYKNVYLDWKLYFKMIRGKEVRIKHNIKYYVVLAPKFLSLEGTPTGETSLILKTGDLGIKLGQNKMTIHLRSSENFIATISAKFNEERRDLRGGIVIRF